MRRESASRRFWECVIARSANAVLARPFGVGTYFPKEQVRAEGPSKVYVRGSDSGRKIEQHFCSDCGSPVFSYSERFPDLIDIAFGAFADPSMPRPLYPCGRRHGIPG